MSLQKSEETNALISMIEKCAINKDVDVDKLSKILDMQERILNRQAYQAYCSAFSEMQAELPEIEKNGAITINNKTQSKYALMEDIQEAVKPILQKHGFAVFFRPKQEPGIVSVKAVLMHTGGHAEEIEITVPVDNSGNKNSVQAVGSSLQYCKRYAIGAILNLTIRGLDDDAQGADPLATDAQKKIIISLFDKFSEAEKEMFTNATGGVDKIKRQDVDSVIAKMKRTLELKSKPDVTNARNN